MSYNIGPKIGIDGEAEFRKQIKNINNEYKTLQAETKALTAEFEKNGDQQGKLQMEQEQLTKQIEVQTRKLQPLEDAIAKATKITGENSDAVTRLKGVYYDTKATIAGLEGTLDETKQALKHLEEGAEDAGNAADEAGEDFSIFGDVLKADFLSDVLKDALGELKDLVVDFAKGSVEAAAELQAENAQFAQTFGEMENAAEAALEKVAEKTGTSATRIKGNYATVYAFAKTMGTDSEEALDIASRAMVAAADSAAYYDKSVEEVTESLQAYLKGNYANDAALGIASTETTRNAKANELYAKSFNELTESQKIDTLLAMVEAGNEASGAMGQAAREAESWTNVNGELDDAMKQLQATLGAPVLKTVTPIIQEITEEIREMARVTEGQKLAEEIDSFTNAWEKAEETYKSTESVTLATAAVAEDYVRELQALETAGLNTAEAHQQYENLVIRLNSLIPDLNLTINEQTGLINQNTEALLGDIAAWKDAAITQAAYAKMKDQLEAYGDAVVAVREGEYKLQQNEAARAEMVERLNQLYGITGDLVVRTYVDPHTFSTWYDVYDKAGNKVKSLNKHLFEEKTTEVELLDALLQHQDERNALNTAIEEGKNVIEDYGAAVDEAQYLLGELSEGNGETAESQEQLQQAITETQGAVDELSTSYQDARTAAKESLGTVIGLWDEMEEESKYSAEQIVENWRKQRRAILEYNQNLKKAESMGLDEGIVKALSDGSQESMQILDALVNDSEMKVGEINAAFTHLDDAKENTAETMAQLQTDFNDKMAELAADAYNGGMYIADGIVKGLHDGLAGTNHELEELLDEVMYQCGFVADNLDITLQPSWDASGNASTAGVSITNGDIHFEITQLPGENAEELAFRAAQILMQEISRRGAGLNG